MPVFWLYLYSFPQYCDSHNISVNKSSSRDICSYLMWLKWPIFDHLGRSRVFRTIFGPRSTGIQFPTRSSKNCTVQVHFWSPKFGLISLRINSYDYSGCYVDVYFNRWSKEQTNYLFVSSQYFKFIASFDIWVFRFSEKK